MNRMSAASQAPQEVPPGHVLPAFPLALLEAVRAHDRPGEVLEDEDLTISLPRRLGLTGVIGSQIHRYETAQKSGKSVPFSEVYSLLQLVIRRPDAGAILWETGQQLAGRRFERVPGGMVKLLRVLPGAGRGSAARVVRRLLRSLSGGLAVETRARPFTVRLPDCPVATLDALGTGCQLYTGAIERIVTGYTGKPTPVEHTRCRARGQPLCEWRAEGG